MPVSARMSATTPARLGWTNWRADRLTLMARRRFSACRSGLPGRGLAQHVGADGHDQAGLLGQGDGKLRSAIRPRSGCSQRTRASAPTARPLPRQWMGWYRTRARCARPPGAATSAWPGGAWPWPASPGRTPRGGCRREALGPVHGGVGVLDQRLGPAAAARGQGDADAHGDEHLGVAQGEQGGGHLGDPLGDGQGVGLVGDALAQEW